MLGHIGHGFAEGEGVFLLQHGDHAQAVLLIQSVHRLAQGGQAPLEEVGQLLGVPLLPQGGLQIRAGAHEIHQNAVCEHQRGVVEVDAQGQVVVLADHVEGGGFGLASVGGGGGQVDKVGDRGVGVQLQADAQDIHGGAHLSARDMAVIDGQNGMGGDSHIVHQRLTGGAEHLGNASGGAV